MKIEGFRMKNKVYNETWKGGIMQEQSKDKIEKLGNYIGRHWIILSYATIITLMVIAQAGTIRDLQKFLKSHDLLEEFFGLEEA